MLDALVAEARERWGLDPAAGLQVVASEGLVGTPIEPSRPLLIVPLEVLGVPARAGAGDPATPLVTDAAPLPGRDGPAGRDPLGVLARLYPPDAMVARLGTPAARGGGMPAGDAGAQTTIGALTATDLAAPLYVVPIPPEAAVAGGR